MNINIYGMGYVGCVTAACMAKEGKNVTGIDVDPLKVQMINEGNSPIVETGLAETIREAVDAKNLNASLNNNNPADISIVCVGTPSKENGSLHLTHIRKVAESIGEYIGKIDSYHVVNIRSTVLPGTVEEVIIPIIEKKSKKRAGHDFGVCMNPEFMREGSSLHDYYNPPFTVIGELDKRSGDAIAKIFSEVNAPLIRTSIKVAEMVKYSCNSFHALKVAFANEIGNICKKLDIDSHEVMNVFCKDTKLNISSSYLKPGFAFGGSCLPKDLRALLYKAKDLDLELPLLDSILRSNACHVDKGYKIIERTGKKKVGILGLSFKPGTDDLRESPMVELVEKLIGKGYEVGIYDEEVSIAKIFGTNKKFIEVMIPHISSLIKNSIHDVIQSCEVVVLGKKENKYKEAILNSGNNVQILDLVRIFANLEKGNNLYEGICW